jgi:hypothetical protein
MKRFFYFLMLLGVITSCTNESEPVTLSQEKDVEVITDSGEKIMKFKNRQVFDETVESLKCLDSEEKKSWSEQHGLFSLYSFYEEAMLAAADIKTNEDYYAFKAKYENHFYFPEYEDDYGAYMPLKRQYAACVLTPNAEVIIGDEKVNMRDVFKYADLQESGKALYDDPGLELRYGNNDYVGTQYDSGWIIYSNSAESKKVKVKIGRRIRNVQQKRFAIHVEISFRKHMGLLGWGNYSSTTVLGGTFQVGSLPVYTINTNQRQSGTSSHDHYLLDGDAAFYSGNVTTFATADVKATLEPDTYHITTSGQSFLRETFVNGDFSSGITF